MLSFKGSITKANSVEFYQAWCCYNPETKRWVGMPCCIRDVTWGASPALRNKYVEGNLNPEYAWGYEGDGSTLLAIDILAIYAGQLASHIDPIWTGRNFIGKSGHGFSFVKKHYKAFSSEVIANLPDNWTLTYEQIDEWVKKREGK